MIGSSAAFNSTVRTLSAQVQQVGRLQEQIATGLRVIRGSDDPGDALHIMNLRDTSALFKTYQSNLNHLRLDMEQLSGSFNEISSLLTRVKQLMTQALTGSYSQENKKAIAVEIGGILEQLVSMANSQSVGHYIFSGGQTDVQPFEVQREGEEIVSVSYKGGTENTRVPVSGGMTMTGRMIGKDVFGTDGPGIAHFLGDTGVRAGDGTSSFRGDAWLSVNNTDTTFDDGGAASGIESGNGADTIIGEHTLTVNAAERTIRLGDGDEVAFTDQTDLRLENAHGDIVHVDVSGYDGEFDGTIQLRGNGTLSLDDGATTVPIDFETNQAVKDPDGEGTLYLNTTGIKREGVEPVHMEGASDLFDLLIHIRDTLNDERDLSRNEQKAVLEKSFDSLEGVIGEITRHMTSLGSRLQSLESLDGHLQAVEQNAEAEASQLGDANMVEVVTELARSQTFYEMALMSSSKVLSLSLLDFI